MRKLATEIEVSTFTVVEAYDRLVALGLLQSRPGSGYFVTARPLRAASEQQTALPQGAYDYVWLLRGQLQDTPGKLNVSTGKLPRGWNDQELVRRGLKLLAGKTDESLNSYGEPNGHTPLRQLLQLRLNEMGIRTTLPQIVLTQGATQALELCVRLLLQPGDPVMVDDPGYFNLFGNLQLHGIKLLPVPRTPDGPDVETVQRLASEHKPKIFFTQSLLHNPTGTSLSPHVAFRLLQLASHAGFKIVENDCYGDFMPSTVTRLATLDQLRQVIYVSSFSKTVSAAVRVGYLACSEALAEDFVNIKMLSSITSAQLNERLIYYAFTEGHYRRHIDRLRGLLSQAMARTLPLLEKFGFEVFSPQAAGKFVWARHPAYEDSTALSRLAAERDIILAPGSVFRPHLESTPWLRLNVAYGDHPSLVGLLKRIAR